MAETIVAYGGQLLPISSLEITLGYTAGFVTSQTCEYAGVTYVQTITRDGSGNTLEISQFVPQPSPLRPDITAIYMEWVKVHKAKKEKYGWGTTIPLLSDISADQYRALRRGALKQEELGKV